MSELINNTDWLAGYEAFENGEPCPWGNSSARYGWLAARIAEHRAMQEAIEAAR